MKRPLTDRQTDRQTEHKWWYQKYRQLIGIGEYQESARNVEGGRDRKWRQLQGIGEFAKPTNAFQKGRSKSETSNAPGVADGGSTDNGEPP